MIKKDGEADVLLAFAHNGSVATVFMDSVLAAFAEDARQPRRRLVEYYPQGSPYIHSNRSLIARYFLECTDKQWLWFLDNDMDFPVDSLYRMLAAAEAHDCGILGAAYWNTYPGTQTYLSWLVMSPEHGVIAVPRLPPEPDRYQPVEVSAVGMGCTLIHRDVLQDVTDSYPNDPWATFAADMLVRFDDGRMLTARVPDDLGDQIDNGRVVDIQRMGEDVTFCLRARRCGHRTFGLPSLVAKHYKTMYVPHGMPELEPAGVTAASGV